MFRHINGAGDGSGAEEDGRKRERTLSPTDNGDNTKEETEKKQTIQLNPCGSKSIINQMGSIPFNWAAKNVSIKANNMGPSLSNNFNMELQAYPLIINYKRSLSPELEDANVKKKRRKDTKKINPAKRPKVEPKRPQNSKLGKCPSETISNFQFPPEVMLQILKKVSHQSLFRVLSVGQHWEDLVLDYSLWDQARDLKLSGNAPSTENAKIILHHARNVQCLHISGRNDLDQLLDLDPARKPKLWSIVIEHCRAGALHRYLSSLIETCPRLRSLAVKYTSLYEPSFYRTLAQHHGKLDTVRVTCAAKKQMETFVTALRRVSPNVQFREDSMRGNVGQKRISWDPILGLQLTNQARQYPSYVF